MKIEEVTATPFRLPFAREISLSTGIRGVAENVLVSVRTSDGVVGHAECLPRPTLYGETFGTAAQVIEQVLAPKVHGLSVGNIELIHDRLAFLAGNYSARSAIEIAAFDAFAQTIGRPAHELLGGYQSSIACCPLLGYGTPDEVAEEALAAISEFGVGTLKFKVGASAEGDAAVARRVREAVGDDVAMYADANGRFTFAEAMRFIAAVSDLQLRWLEEPTSASAADRARLVDAVEYPIFADESAITPRAASGELLGARATGIVIKPARTGIVDSSRIRSMCDAIGVPVCVGSQGDSAIGALIAAAFAASAPSTAANAAEVLFYQGLADQLVADLPTVSGGRMSLPDRPGFGVDIDQAKVARYAA